VKLIEPQRHGDTKVHKGLYIPLSPDLALFACPNDLQIGQAKTTKKLNKLRNSMGIFHVLQALLPDQFEMHPILN
jgi:hypothetical protein